MLEESTDIAKDAITFVLFSGMSTCNTTPTIQEDEISNKAVLRVILNPIVL